MKRRKGFNLRNVCGERIIVAEGRENIDFSKIISMNESSEFLWNAIDGKDFTTDDLVRMITDEYEVDEATARQDAETVVQLWTKAGIVE